MAAQNDVELFECKQRFFTDRKVAWINRILAYYGLNQWYLVVDSDELLVYDNCEKNNILLLLQCLEKKGISAISGIMIDMYSVNKQERINNENIYASLNYFDKTGYYVNPDQKWYHMIYGGVRSRFIEPTILSKTPLFFLDKQTIYTTCHHLFPSKKNFQMINGLGLLHYKFLESDIKNYQERIKENNMHDSIAYRIYIDKLNTEKELSFYNEDISEKYENSQSLVKYNLIKKLGFF